MAARPRLVHLNGVPGCGKSTLAALYAGRHARILNLDVDTLVPMVGGWADDFFAAFDVARGLAAAMAARYLATGRDVILPQMITNQRESDDFEEAAASACADYVHLVIDADPTIAMARLDQRSIGADAVRQAIRAVIRRNGDLAFIEKLKSQVDSFAATKAIDGRVDASLVGVEEVYARVAAVLSGTGSDAPAI